MRIGEISSCAEYRISNNYKICEFFETNSGFPNSKNSRILLIFHIVKFWKLLVFQFGKFKRIPI